MPGGGLKVNGQSPTCMERADCTKCDIVCTNFIHKTLIHHLLYICLLDTLLLPGSSTNHSTFYATKSSTKADAGISFMTIWTCLSRASKKCQFVGQLTSTEVFEAPHTFCGPPLPAFTCTPAMNQWKYQLLLKLEVCLLLLQLIIRSHRKESRRSR